MPEAEFCGAAHAVRRMVDDGDAGAAGEQHLRRDLAEAGKADHQHVGFRTLEIFLQLLFGRSGAMRNRSRRGRRAASSPSTRDDGDQQRCRLAREDRRLTAAAEKSTKANSPPCGSSNATRTASSWRQPNMRQTRRWRLTLTAISTGTAMQDRRPVVDDDVEVERQADGHEEQAEQDAAKRLDVGLEFVAVGRIRPASRRQ